MILEELKIEGFRSLKSVTWRPGRLNVLIGPNGGGKSNLLSALDLLHKAATGELRKAVFAMGGMGQLVWDGQASAIAFDLLFRVADGARRTYDLELTRRGSSGSYDIGKELTQTGPGTRTQMKQFSELSDGEAFLSQSPVSDEQPKFLSLARHVRSWSILQNLRTDSHLGNPRRLRKPLRNNS